MKNIVVSGATGFLGLNLVRRFLNADENVWVIVRPNSAKINLLPDDVPNIHILKCNLTDTCRIIRTIEHADAWFHYAWSGVNREEIDSPEVQQENIHISIATVTAAHELGCNVFMDAGSRVEYGIIDGEMKEDMQCHPINEYGKAKLEFYEIAQKMCQKYGMKYCHLRFFSVYGYGDHPWSIISTLLSELPKGNKVSLSACRHDWNFMYIDDASEAVYRLWKAIDMKPDFVSEIVNIASRDTRELKAFVEEVHQITKKKGQLEYGTFQQAKEGALSIVPSTHKLYELTNGWKENFSFAEGIRITIKKGSYKIDEEN